MYIQPERVIRGEQGFPGEPGPQGLQGLQGPPGPSSWLFQAIVVNQNYTVSPDDCYVGIVGSTTVMITLPDSEDVTHPITIKKEESGNNRVTVITDGSSIDGQPSYNLVAPYSSVTLVCSNGRWFTVGRT